jgi:hypothetical protein
MPVAGTVAAASCSARNLVLIVRSKRSSFPNHRSGPASRQKDTTSADVTSLTFPSELDRLDPTHRWWVVRQVLDLCGDHLVIDHPGREIPVSDPNVLINQITATATVQD